MNTWTDKEIEFLKHYYPIKGKTWCSLVLLRPEASIRQKASRLNLKQDKNSDFFKDWQNRAKNSKIGKKRPDQALVIKKLHEEGKLKYTEERKKAISIRKKEWIAKNGHPKGSLGLKHSEETKKILSEKSKKYWDNISDEELNIRSKRCSELGRKSIFNREKATWKAGWREIGGKKKYYRSRWEANYARYLEKLKNNKQILDWKHEPKTFWFEGIKRGVMSYLPDFWIKNVDETEEYHEVKGWMDDKSKVKIKRMGIYHPNVKLIIIDSKQYKLLEKVEKFLISDWEQ